MNECKILIVDDDPAMQKVLPITFEKEQFEPRIAKDGTSALEMLLNDSSFDCVILDIRMPGMQGTEVLAEIRHKYPLLPVIMLTALDDLETAVSTLRKGAFHYLVKPVRKVALIETVRKAVNYRTILLENERLAKENEEYQKSLELKVEERTRELKDAYRKLKNTNIETVQVLAETIEAKDPYTRGHCARVRHLSLEIAKVMGVPREERELIEYGALLHDIGKIGISESLLFKAGPLTDEELGAFRLHPVIGENILRDVDFFKPIIPIIRNHHEWFDGTGYPDCLPGEQIPLLARIVTLADAFDAMSSNRPYRKALEIGIALAEIKNGAESQFDPGLVEIFLKNEFYSL